MYCKSCKTEVNPSSKYCPNCGKLLSETDDFLDQGVLGFIESKIKAQTTFLSTQDFLQGAKPLRFRWIITVIAAMISVPIYCLGVIPAFMLTLYICLGKNIKLNARKYPLPCEIDIENLGDFLRRNLSSLSFTEWQVGVPSVFGLKDDSVMVIQCVFEHKTIHRIVFEEGKDTYKIIVEGPTTKSFLIRGGTLASSGLMYKNGYRVQPILAAAVEYYLQNLEKIRN